MYVCVCVCVCTVTAGYVYHWREVSSRLMLPFVVMEMVRQGGAGCCTVMELGLCVHLSLPTNIFDLSNKRVPPSKTSNAGSEQRERTNILHDSDGARVQ